MKPNKNYRPLSFIILGTVVFDIVLVGVILKACGVF